MSQAPQHLKSSEIRATCDGSFPSGLSVLSFSLTQACSGQYVCRVLQILMLVESMLGLLVKKMKKLVVIVIVIFQQRCLNMDYLIFEICTVHRALFLRKRFTLYKYLLLW